MGGSFFIGLSGLNANAQGIKNVGNNLANSNTIGYKATNLFFEELRAAIDIGGISGGQGVISGSTQQVWTQGNVQQSQVATDMALQGSGFFVVGDNVNSQYYTRAGNFQVNKDGYLVTQDGKFVMGYPAVRGTIDTNSPLGPISLAPGTVLPAQASTTLRFVSNLNSQAAEGESFSTSAVVYDSLGASHTVTATFTKTANSGEWDYDISILETDVDPNADPSSTLSLATGTLAFDSDGNLADTNPQSISLQIQNLANGADDLEIGLELFKDGTLTDSYVTQYNLPSSTSESFQDGNGAGTLTSVFVLENGVIEGLFSNGETAPLGQVAAASFTNPQGLVRVGENMYARTSTSGEPTIGEPGTGGRGIVRGNSIEMSNVDIAEEFIKMIVFQRGYQANSRVVTTSDQITLEALQLKQ